MSSKEEFHSKNSQPIASSRVINATPERIKWWFTKAEEELRPKECRPELIFNMDEIMLDSTPKRVKVMVPKDKRPLQIRTSESDGFHITLVLGIAADGGHLKPSLILPLKTFPLSCIELVHKFNWAGQAAGWMAAEIFKSWGIQVFIPTYKPDVKNSTAQTSELSFSSILSSHTAAPRLWRHSETRISMFSPFYPMAPISDSPWTAASIAPSR